MKIFGVDVQKALSSGVGQTTLKVVKKVYNLPEGNVVDLKELFPDENDVIKYADVLYSNLEAQGYVKTEGKEHVRTAKR